MRTTKPLPGSPLFRRSPSSTLPHHSSSISLPLPPALPQSSSPPSLQSAEGCGKRPFAINAVITFQRSRILQQGPCTGWKERTDEWKPKHGFLGGGDLEDMDLLPGSKGRLSVNFSWVLKTLIQKPAEDAAGLWLTSIVCEIWFSIPWILNQFPKWFPIDRLSLSF